MVPSAASVLIRVREQEYEQGGQDGRHQRPGHDPPEVARTRDQEADADAGKRRVGERVAKQALLAQHGETAQHAAGDAEQDGAHGDVLDRVVAEQGQHWRQGPSLWGASTPRGVSNDPLSISAMRPPYARLRCSPVYTSWTRPWATTRTLRMASQSK